MDDGLDEMTSKFYPPLMGGIRATVSPFLSGSTDPCGTYSSFSANVKVASSSTIFASDG